MNEHITREDRARTFQRDLTLGFNFVSVTPDKTGNGFVIDITSGQELVIRQKAEDFFGAGNYTIKPTSLAIGK